MAEPTGLDLPHLSALLLEALQDGENAAMVVALTHPDPSRIGSRILVAGPRNHGTLWDVQADNEAVALARRALGGDPQLLPGTYALSSRGGTDIQVFLELHHPPWEMVIVGAGHVAQPLCTLGALLGLRVTVLDDRPQFATRERFPEAETVREVDFSDPFAGIPLHRWSHVVLVTRGHKYDYECLRNVLMQDALPGYVGMIGSRRRVRATFDALLTEGIPREKLEAVHAPIGLDLGSETPGEIAVSVAAELVHHWRGGTGRPLSELEHILDRFHPSDRGGGAGPGQMEPGDSGTHHPHQSSKEHE
ncbi:MAG: XdhC family protein [Gemmatimonadota bacterium]|jgi:xanthine dehydrogenase accessory factor